MKLTRRNQLWILIFLSALSALAYYIIQGTFAGGDNPKEFGELFWKFERGLWGFRAFVEAWVVAYLFSTITKNKLQTSILVLFEISLISLIALTNYPAIYTLASQSPIVNSLTDLQLRWWSLGLGAYVSLFIGGVGYAYRIQPTENEDELQIIKNKLEIALSEKQNYHLQNEKLIEKIEGLESSLNGDLSWGKLAGVLTEKGMKKGDVIEVVTLLGGKAAWVSRGIDKTSKIIMENS